MENIDNIKIRKFTDLIVWREAHKLVLIIYKCTKFFPYDEKFGLVSQMRRSAVSITSNVAEGFSRKSFREKIQFYYVSKSSLTELQNQLIISKDIEYIRMSDYCKIDELITIVDKLLTGIIRKSKTLC